MPYKDKTAQALSAKKHYEANKERIKSRARKFSDEAIIRNRQYVWDYFMANPCIDCGEKDPIVLELDHRNAEEKRDNVSDLIKRPVSIKVLEQEILKCDVRCANCHRRKTAQQFGYYRSINT